MAYTPNWVTKVISIPTSDLTLISGTHYSIDMAVLLAEVRRLEWEFDGLWAPAILDHSDTRFDFAGANYAPFDEFINGYTVQFTGAATRVDLLGSNNNLIDVLIANGVSVVPSNSAGLQVYFAGGGVGTPGEVADAVWNANEADHQTLGTFGWVIAFIRKLAGNRASISQDTFPTVTTIYDDDGVTPIHTLDNPDKLNREPR